jgi:hypothetical protein
MDDRLFDEVAAESSEVATNGQEVSNNRRPGLQMADAGGARGRLDFSRCEVKAWFESHEHYGRQAGGDGGKHTVLCPWEQEHQGRPDGTDTDTVIYVPTETRPAAFVCKHAHCAKRTLADVAALWADAERFGARQRGHDEEGGPSRAQAMRVVAMVKAISAELFNDGENGFITFPTNGHQETWPVRSKRMRKFVGQLCYADGQGFAMSSDVYQAAVTVLEGQALYGGPKRSVNHRLGAHEGKLYLDLVNDAWEVVEIDRDGWRIVTHPPVQFQRKNGALSLPLPERGGSITELRPFVNVASDEDFALLVGWELMTLHPAGPYPHLQLTGEQGCAKTTTAWVLRDLVDPNLAQLRGRIDSDRDLMIAAVKSQILGFDNLSSIPKWLSDAFCCLSTGAAYSVREHYENDEEVIFATRCAVVLTAIGNVATEPDLLDRLLILRLPNLGDGRESEAGFRARFADARPRILGALLDAVSCALRNQSHVEIKDKIRMLDFATWVSAAEPALGWDQGAFMRAYQGNREEAVALAVESSPIAQSLQNFLGQAAATAGWNGCWEGTATTLLEALNQFRSTTGIPPAKQWPKSPDALGTALRHVAPALRATGTTVDFAKPDKYTRLIRLIPGDTSSVSGPGRDT